MEGKTLLRPRRLDGLYRERVRLIWDNWRQSRLRKFILTAAIILTMSLSAVFPGQILGESGAGSPNRLWSSGAELNSLTADIEVTGSSGTVSISSSTVRSGTYAYRANPTSGTGVIFKTWANSTQTNKFWFRTYLRIATAPSANTYVFRIGSGANGKISVRLTSSSTLQLRNEEDDVSIGSASSALSTNTWYRLEVFVDTTTLSSTDAEMRLDGVSIASSTSENLAAGIDRLTWGVLNSTTADLFFDDIAINDSNSRGDNWPGEGKVVHMLPNANGDTNSWTRDPANCNGSSNNYECVDEVTPNDATDFLRSQTNNQVQEVNLVSSSSVGIGSGDLIKLASVGLRLQPCGDSSGGFGCVPTDADINYQSRIKPNASGTVQESSSISILDSADWVTNDDDTAKLNKLTTYHQPGTTQPWTSGTLDSAQIGIANRDTLGVGFRLTAIWLQVEYVPAGGGRIFSSGFELNSTTAGMEWTSFAGSPTIVTSPVRSGSYALQTASGGAQSFAQYHFSASNQDGPYFVRVYLRIATSPSGEGSVVELRDSTNTRRAYISLTATNTLKLFDEDGQIGSASSALSTATWYRVELQFNRNGGTNSTVEARIDGGSAFATSSTRSVSTGVARLAVGQNINNDSLSSGQLIYDDVAVNTNEGTAQNSYPGEGKIVHLRPNAAGDNSGWTTNGTCTGGNFGCVDEVTPNDSTNRVSSTAANTIDDYNIDNPGFGSGTDINVVSVGVRFNSASATQESFRVRLKDSSGGVPIESPNLSPASTTWVTNQTAEPRNYPLTAYTRPEQSTSWTKTVLDSSQIGVRNVLDGSGTAQVTALWLLVEYNEPLISISGRVFTDEGSTGLDCSTSRTVRVKVNGAGDYAASCSNSPSNGSYTVSGISITAAGDVLTVFLDGATEKAVTVSRAADTTSNITSFDLYQNRVITRHEDTGPITNSNLDQFDSGNDADIQFTVTSGALTVSSGAKLLVWTGKTFTPGGNVTTPKLHIQGTYTGGSETLTLSGTGSGTTCGAAAQMPLCVDGTFNSSSNTTKFTGDGAVTIAVQTYNNLDLTPTITSNQTYTFGSGALTINGDFNINPAASSALALTVNMGAAITVGAAKTTTITRTTSATSNLDTTASNYALSTGKLDIATGGTLTANGSTITLTGTSGTLFTRTGTFTAGTSTVVMNPDAAVTLTSGAITFNNLTLSPTITANRTYTFGSGALTINGDFNINPAASSALALTVNMGAAITVGAAKTTTITRTTSATSNLDTTASNYALSTGKLDIATGGTLTANGSTITLTGTSGTLFTKTGTFTAGTSTVVMNPDAAVTLTSGTITFNNLTLSPTITANRTYTFGSGALTVNGDLGITPTLNGNQAIYSIIHDGTNYVAAGLDYSAGSYDAVIWESTNRTSWTRRVVDGTAGSFQGIFSIIHDGTNYVAAGLDYSADANGDAVIWESTNRTSWTKRVVDGTAGSTQVIASIIHDGTNYVAAGVDDSADVNGDAVIWESTNRTSWTKRVVDGTAGSYQAIASIIHDGTNYVAAGSDYSADANRDAVIWESTNRTSWTRRVVDGTAGSYQAIYSIIHDGTNYVAAGEDYSADDNGDAVIWESTNRTSWTRRVVDGTAGSYQFINSIIHDGTNYVAAGVDESADANRVVVIWESTNRTSWTKRVVDGTAGSYQTIYSIIHDGTNYVAAGEDYSADDNGDAVIWESTNRTSWRGQGLGDTSLVLTLNLGGNIAVASGKTATIGYGSVSLVVDTMPVATPYNLSTGNLTIKPYATLDSTGATSAINVAGNYTNNGTFTAGSSTVTLNGTSTQTLSGTMTGSSSFYNLTITNNSGASATSCERDGFTASVDFNAAATVSNNFTITTANVRIEYNSGSTYTFTNINWNGQAAGTRIYFRNSAASGTWLLNVSGTQTAVSYVNVSRSDASGGNTINAADGTNVDCGNNDNWDFTGNTNPNDPTDLVQRKTDDSLINNGAWTNETSVKFVAKASDPDNPDTLQLCVEVKALGQSFTNTEDACGTGVSYSGSPVTVTVTIGSLANDTEYHWQARVKDGANAYSGWVCYVTCSNSTRDFGIDTTPPDATGAVVYDGDQVGVDADYNDGSLTALSANWGGFNASVSGLLRYDYSIGTGQGGTDIKNWTDNSTSTSVTATSLNLRTNQRYYFNVRAVDNAGNISNVISSNGQDVLPTISMSLSALTITFDALNAGNDRSDTKTVTITSSTNGHGGYVVRQYASGLLTAGSLTIPMFEGGTYASPASWSTPCTAGSNCGYGYTSSDTNIQGSNLFNNGTLFAAFAISPFGDIVCDNTGPITGTSGPIVNEQHTITHKVAVSALQAARIYQTQVTYVITGTF